MSPDQIECYLSPVASEESIKQVNTLTIVLIIYTYRLPYSSVPLRVDLVQQGTYPRPRSHRMAYPQYAVGSLSTCLLLRAG